MVAITGLDIGSTILLNMPSCVAPSIFADSITESGIVVLKNVLHIIILNDDTASGSISAKSVSLKFKSLSFTT